MTTEARRQYQRQYYLEHADEMKERARRWQVDHPELHAKYMRKYTLKKRYNLSLEEYDSIFSLQGGKCAICHRTLEEADISKPTFYVDHNHETGNARGLLCARCNFGIGWYDWLNYLTRGS